MGDFLTKLQPIEALLVLGMVGQWLAYRKDLKERDQAERSRDEAATAKIGGLTEAVNKLADRIDRPPAKPKD